MILLIGAGAVGSVLITYLSRAAREPLRLYMRDKDRTAMTGAPQAQVDSVDGRPLLTAPKPELVGSTDLSGVSYLFLCVKFGDLERVLDGLPSPAEFPKSCTVVSTLNGIEALRVLRRRLPGVRIVPMTIMYNAQWLGPLHAQITTKPVVVLGGEPDARLQASLAGSGMQVLVAQGDEAVWGKLLINLANAVCAITHSSAHELLTLPALREVFVAVLEEALTVLNQSGVAYQWPMPIPFKAYRALLKHGGPVGWWLAKTKNGLRKGSYPSMVSDVEQGRPTEVMQLNGEIARLGAEHSIDTPLASQIVSLVQELVNRKPPRYLSPEQLRQALGI
jgi:2-dehydropantoate 2-reductase